MECPGAEAGYAHRLHMKRTLSVVSLRDSMYTNDQPIGNESIVVGFRTKSTLNRLQKSAEYVFLHLPRTTSASDEGSDPKQVGAALLPPGLQEDGSSRV
jgi:hypothetical protein